MRLQIKPRPQFLFSSLALLAFTSDLRISAAHFPKRYRFAVLRPLSWHSPRALIVWILNQGPPWTRRVAGPCHHPPWRAHARAGCSSKSTAKRHVVMRFDNTPTTKRKNYNHNFISTLFSISISCETQSNTNAYNAQSRPTSGLYSLSLRASALQPQFKQPWLLSSFFWVSGICVPQWQYG